MADPREQCRCAFVNGRKRDALRLLSEVEQPDPDLVHLSAYCGWEDVCRQLVENYNLNPSPEATIPIIGGIDKPRPLLLACAYGRVEVVKYLLTLPAVMLTVNERDAGCDGLSEWACRYEHL